MDEGSLSAFALWSLGVVRCSRRAAPAQRRGAGEVGSLQAQDGQLPLRRRYVGHIVRQDGSRGDLGFDNVELTTDPEKGHYSGGW